MSVISHPLVLAAILVGLVLVAWNLLDPVPGRVWAGWAVVTIAVTLVAHHFTKPPVGPRPV